MGTPATDGRPRVAVVGGGIAGALLAWRLTQAGGGPVAVELYTGGAAAGGDATAASGGLVRGFESDPVACQVAATSLAELLASPTLRGWAGYREVGAVYLLPPGADPGGCVRIMDGLLPGSARVLDRHQLAAEYPLRGLAAGTIGVVERRAGYLSPARLRAAVLAELAAGGCVVHDRAVTAVAGATGPAGGPALRLAGGPLGGHHPARDAGSAYGSNRAPGIGGRHGSNGAAGCEAVCGNGAAGCGTVCGYDAVVVAAGAWTAGLLAAGGLPAVGLRSKQIQYSLHAVHLPGLGAFVEHESGFYGRPADGGAFLLGLPSSRWDVTPGAVAADTMLAERVTAYAIRRLAARPAGRPLRTVASFDCYHQPPGLALRRVLAGTPVFTFTGGSGGAAKTVLADSRLAAVTLLAELATRRPAARGRPSAHPMTAGTPTTAGAGTPTAAPGRPTVQTMTAGTPTLPEGGAAHATREGSARGGGWPA